jgi:hypothetical protein
MNKKDVYRQGTLAASLDVAVFEQLQMMREQLAQHKVDQNKQSSAADSPVPVPVKVLGSIRGSLKVSGSLKAGKKNSKSQPTLVKVENDGQVDIFLKVTAKTDLEQSALNKSADQGIGAVKNREKLSRAGQSRVERATSFSNRHTSSLLTKGLTPGVMLSMEWHKVNLVTGTQGPLVLKVHRGAFLKEAAFCSVCHSPVAPLYRYADSNYGPVILCSVCKTQVFERSFGHADAMPLAVDHAHAHKGKW